MVSQNAPTYKMKFHHLHVAVPVPAFWGTLLYMLYLIQILSTCLFWISRNHAKHLATIQSEECIFLAGEEVLYSLPRHAEPYLVTEV